MWVSVKESLPTLGREVPVFGQYVSPNTGYPLARLCNCRWLNGFHFESREWRGMVGISHWWKEKQKKRRRRN
jgi:hypothetical protein